ncbi:MULTISPECIES: CBS domain-containing protein [unclassified Parafrankia]|uniref:CBS domain-containing protein n=1 Tax=unclassified Parafrankia TaxID=2994368 RepID=UPI000DA53D1C|nr:MULTISPECIES: CBS domain-containing protein [unclassified Parafrankia]TCJ35102.1 CBS domain-containing protein [Parafrankia sp. BMG5.11]CAI7973489.1 putative signal transduction protein with CBS domains [Frankia sp. Hr75.2]SQE00121.1 putative signal transduction protein with CBS domains [Parafrankia sp. Ea1.12]
MTGEITFRAPVTVPAPTPIREAAELMDRAGVGSLLVVDEGRLAGIVTDRDLALRAVARAVPLDARIDAVMTCGVVTVGPSAGWEEITRVFAEHAIRRLVVTDGDTIVGVVALDDLLAAAADPHTAATGPRNAALGAVAAAEIGHPHHEGGLPLPLDALRPRPRTLSRWQARVGDAVVVRAAVGNGPKRDGEILEVATPAGDPPFLVRWSDGRLSYIHPGPDARIHHYGEPVGSAR